MKESKALVGKVTGLCETEAHGRIHAMAAERCKAVNGADHFGCVQRGEDALRQQVGLELRKGQGGGSPATRSAYTISLLPAASKTANQKLERHHAKAVVVPANAFG